MKLRNIMRGAILGGLVASLGACNGIGSGDSWPFGGRNPTRVTVGQQPGDESQGTVINERGKVVGTGVGTRRSSFLDLFTNRADPNTTVEVNKYLWQASLEVLDFLPIQSVDPFSGVIVTGYGTPPGGGRAYRATIYVQDPALDARSLKVALASRAGPVDPATHRAVEDAILTRARQIRIRDSRL